MIFVFGLKPNQTSSWPKPRTTGCSLLSELFADIKHNVQYVGTLHIKLHILIYWVKESLIDVQCTVNAPILPKQYSTSVRLDMLRKYQH